MTKLEFYRKVISENQDLNFVLSEINIPLKNNGELSKYFYAIKDNICMKNTVTTGGSLFLKDWEAPYNATVINLLEAEGANPIIKVNMDEFGLGGTGTFSAYGVVHNPHDKTRISGGSSSGSAVAVAIGACDFALGTDTGDSIRKPASYNGIIGYKPTYGIISRYGVLPYAPSLDHVGLLARKFKVIFDVMKVIGKHDSKDYSSQETSIDFSFVNLDLSKLKVCVLNEMYEGLEETVIKLFDNAISKLNSNITHLDFGKELLQIIPSIYQILTYSEAVSCYQNFNGLLFGQRNEGEDFEDTARKYRTSFLGSEIKRRFTIGAYCTAFENYEELFLNSKKYRTLLNQRAKEILSKHHFLISVGSSTVAPTIEDVNNKQAPCILADDILQIANFGGFPSVTIPMGKINGMPIGINITSRINSDQYLLSFAQKFYKLLREGDDNE